MSETKRQIAEKLRTMAHLIEIGDLGEVESMALTCKAEGKIHSWGFGDAWQSPVNLVGLMCEGMKSYADELVREFNSVTDVPDEWVAAAQEA